MNFALTSDEILDGMHRALFELCKITSDAVIANRRKAAGNYPSALADKLNAVYPELKADMDAAYRMWDAVAAETEARRHAKARRHEAIRDWVADGAVIEDARGDVTWTVNGTQC